jgi:farnesyl diphosphate synthase
MEFRSFYQNYSAHINTALKQILDERANQIPLPLADALRYSTLNGGKRLRPVLVYAAGYAVVNDQISLYQPNLDYCACACELLHCYSLVHDDLPAMDNDDWRRGQLACHKQFSEADAILTGDALQALAFELLSQKMISIKPEQQLDMIRLTANAAGCQGMAGGQAIDMSNNANTLEALILMHRLKTGALFKAAIGLGAQAVGCEDDKLLKGLDHFADHMGLAYQIQDDIIDFGNPQDSDSKNNKCTFVSFLGLEKAKLYLQTIYQQAIDSLNILSLQHKILQELLDHFIKQ